MCLAVPLKVVSLEGDGKHAVGEAAGLTQKMRVDWISCPISRWGIM